MSESSNESLEEARRYVRRKRIFYTVLGIWLALSLMWFLIDLSDDSSSYWFYWPMLGTGIAVAITGIILLGIGGLFGADWERREIDKTPPQRERARAVTTSLTSRATTPSTPGRKNRRRWARQAARASR